VQQDRIVIDGPEAHHILNVLRLEESDEVTAFDGEGREYTGVIKEARRRSLVIEITGTRDALAEEKVSVTLGQAIPKKEKMDYIVEKATELGASSIIPFETERSVVRIKADRREGRLARWRRIAAEAAKQCANPVVPKIEEPFYFKELLARIRDYDLSLMACLAGDTESIKGVLEKNKSARNILVLIGPEGDFTKEEAEAAKSKGCRLISLGRNVLKSDTAGLALLAMINYEYGR
jgi:16S rRNA (uracil1498-N3)-methyltransferase